MNNKNKLANIITLEDFMPYQLSILSNKISALIAATYEDKFGISITEWRIMAVLGECPNASADFVSLKTQIEKSAISRAIAKLLKRNLIEREFDTEDRRRSVLNLSRTGRDIYQELVPVSFAYEDKLLECFSDEEQKQFCALLNRLHNHTDQIKKE